ncbi:MULTISPECIES: metalloregulator ArsR/SmtB family transcription factor [unclassified Exiguobacterium]|uniref:ArsR/SmtB family transcription factor n=1 Tax=Exiguobacterium TaxID=33986 RepID=UPI0004A94D42|nr:MULTISPECIES: metalloregulator ArsR/SmtB family transcription factor [unclassified Exiguobacterium]KDN56883.1 ArsR family transcriptional regulator [Exiguobacterium sp. AB2]
MKAPQCETIAIQQEQVAELQTQLDQFDATRVSRLFKAFADPTRMKVLYVLTLEQELCVCDVAAVIGHSNATASHHLRTLLDQGLVKYRKDGKVVYYSLDDDHVRSLVEIAMAHSAERHPTEP